MGSLARRMFLLVSLMVDGEATAATRLSVGPVEGDRGAVLPTQLASALCGRFECVVWAKVSSKGKPDPAKVRQAGVAGVLAGSVERKGGSSFATLSLLTGAPPPLLTWRFRLTAEGKVSGDDLRLLEREIVAKLAAPTSTPPPRAPPGTVAPAAAAPAVTMSAPAQPAAATPAPETPSAPAASPKPPIGDRSQPWLVAAELGFFWSTRELSYGGVGPMTGTLHGFKADAIGGAQLHLELFPLARSVEGTLARLGLVLDYGWAIGLETRAPTGEERPTSFSRLQVGVLWRTPPLTGLRLVLRPSLAYQAYQVVVSPTVDGLPDAQLSGLRAGLDVEVPVGGRITLLGGLGWVTWTTAQDLVKGSPAYFPGGSASSLELEAGVDVGLWGPISARALLGHARASYSLDQDPAGKYAASSAEDAVTSLRFTVRGAY